MELKKQTVLIATSELKKQGYQVPEGFIGRFGFFLTESELTDLLYELGTKISANAEIEYIKPSENLVDSFEISINSVQNIIYRFIEENIQ